jgi:hypothetical protein
VRGAAGASVHGRGKANVRPRSTARASMRGRSEASTDVEECSMSGALGRGAVRPEQAHMGGGRPARAWKKAARGVQPARVRRRLVRFQQCISNVSRSREHRYKCRGGGRQPFKVGSRCGEKILLHFIYINVNFCFNSGRIYEKIFQHIGKLRTSWQICI